jgi:glutamate dehydrogenase
MAYVKIQLQADLLPTAVPDDPLLEPYLLAYFPGAVAARFPEAVRAHRVRREIVVAEVANALVDHAGMTFVHRLVRDTGAAAPEVVRAWAIAWAVLGGGALADETAAQRLAVDVEVDCAVGLEGAAERATKWVLANTDPGRSAAAVAAELVAAVGPARSRLADWVAGAEAEAFQQRASQLEMAGLAAPLARRLVTAEWLTGALDVTTVARELGLDVEEAGRRYYALGQQIDFAWVMARLGETSDDDRWQRRAVEGLVADVREARRRLTRIGGTLPPGPLAEVQRILRDLRAAPRVTLAALQVIVYAIRRLTQREGGQ